MLKEITLKEAVGFLDENVPLYWVNLNQEEPKLYKLPDLLAETRILADIQNEPACEKKSSPRRPP